MDSTCGDLLLQSAPTGYRHLLWGALLIGCPGNAGTYQLEPWSPQFHSVLLFGQQGLVEFTHFYRVSRADQVCPGCLAFGLLPAGSVMSSPTLHLQQAIPEPSWAAGAERGPHL